MESENRPLLELPNASLILILGIGSLVGCCISYGLLGLICSIITLILSKGAEEQYRQHPDHYSLSSYNNMRTGRTCAMISLILSIVVVILTVAVILFFGAAALTGGFIT